MRHYISEWRPAFVAFSSHKIYGPTGSGAVLIRKDLPIHVGFGNRAPVGGGTIRSVGTDLSVRWSDPPAIWEAGTPNLAGVEGMVAAIKWMESVGIDAIEAHDKDITNYMLKRLETIPGLEVIGAGQKRGLVTFNVKGLHPEDIARSLGSQKIAVRAGGLCAQPALKTVTQSGLGVRASVAAYTQQSDIDKFIDGLEKTISRLQGNATTTRTV